MQTLSARLAQQVGTATLEGADRLRPGRTGDVVLRLPPTLAETLAPPGADRRTRRNAANARVNVTLSGEGYAIDPAGAQAAPLRRGEANTFRWKVTPDSSGGRGPLKAAVEAEIGPAAARERLAVGEVTGPAPAPATPAERPRASWVWWLLGFLAFALIAAVVTLGGGRRTQKESSTPLNLGRDPASNPA